MSGDKQSMSLRYSIHRQCPEAGFMTINDYVHHKVYGRVNLEGSMTLRDAEIKKNTIKVNKKKVTRIKIEYQDNEDQKMLEAHKEKFLKERNKVVDDIKLGRLPCYAVKVEDPSSKIAITQEFWDFRPGLRFLETLTGIIKVESEYAITHPHLLAYDGRMVWIELVQQTKTNKLPPKKRRLTQTEEVKVKAELTKLLAKKLSDAELLSKLQAACPGIPVSQIVMRELKRQVTCNRPRGRPPGKSVKK